MKRLFALLLICLSSYVVAQHETETSSSVPELTSYHDVIYKMWHNGWPEKDIPLLKSLANDVKDGYSKIKNVKLSGILRDKKENWEKGVIKLGDYVEEYLSTSSKNDSVGLLNATEKLHTQYEMLVRVIRPVMKEVDEFHQVLYMLYHYYLPEYNYEMIKQSVLGLKAKFETLEKAELPKRHESKKEKFLEVRNELGMSVANFNVIVMKGDNKELISAAAEILHSKYEALEGIFK
ncbi:MAG: hypothetical protein FJ214_11850 [Ignavibacteria bacterium]|nr:hypothetical protein [Ignavibacteria bacterium]